MANDGRGSLLERHRLLLKALSDPETSKGDCAVLGAISEHADGDGHGWPGVARLAARLGIARTTVMRSVARLEARGYLEVDRKDGLSNRYRLAETGSVDATGTGSADATSSTVELVAPTHHTGSVDATGPVAPMRRDQSHRCDPNSVQELSSENSVQVTQVVEPVERVTKGKISRQLTFRQWTHTLPDGQKAIPPDDPIFTYARDVQIPRDFLRLSWLVFAEKYRDDRKRYSDWRAVFRNAVRGNWMKLWWIDGGTYQLTTAGKQADMQFKTGIQQPAHDPGRLPRLVA